jgi:3-deoxy-D-manno-octulosonic-acid transferase
LILDLPEFNPQHLYLLFYNLFLGLYRISAGVISPWNVKARRWVDGRKDLLSTIGRQLGTAKRDHRIWMHCASLGEFEQGRPVLEALRERYPDALIVVTFFSSSGYEVRKNYKGADHVFYLPADSAANASRFLDLVQPTLVIWVKYEYWYYYLSELHRRSIPVVLISAIFLPAQVFFKSYGALHRKILGFFTRIFVQTESSKQLLAGIGITEKVEVSGDTRFDRVIDIAEQFTEVEPVAAFCETLPVIIAGSTWEDDEEVLDHFANSNRNIRFIIAPHEVTPERIKEVQSLFRYSVLYSQYLQNRDTAADAPNVLIIDNVGLLSRLYHYATVCYVGGGFGDEGVHNVLEAAVYGKPVVYGPVYHKFIEPKDLIREGGAFSFANALALEKLLNELLSNKELYNQSCKASRDYVYSHRGARNRIMKYISTVVDQV